MKFWFEHLISQQARLLVKIGKVEIQNVLYKAHSNEQNMKTKTIFFNKWLSTGHLDAHLTKS